MPALAFGLKPVKAPNGPAKPPTKRKAAFDDDPEDTIEDQEDAASDAFGALQKPKSKPQTHSKPAQRSSPLEPPRKSPKLDSAQPSLKYNNLSALRSAKLHNAEASTLDSSVYDYDAVYDTLQASKGAAKNGATSAEVPRYMDNLLASSQVRKRDQLRAKEKQVQREREAEGEEFAGKDRFVTGAYKRLQEENRALEEEERRRGEEEEERRRRGGGMVGFHREVLRREEERQRAVEVAEAARLDVVENAGDEERDEEDVDAKIAADLNGQGANIVVNDDGEIVDKRQLLSVGLNVAPKKSGTDKVGTRTDASKPQEWQRSVKQQDARLSQRERQSRMMERQIEEIEAKQREAEAAEKKEVEEKNKSKLTENDKMSAKERYLQRKKEREEETKRAKVGG